VYTKSVLNNGLRVVTEELPAFRSAAVGLWLTVGSRDETAAEGGLTHFLEHMAFKGTGRRNTYEIAREIDQLGGLGNAFTTKEHTCYHARVLAEHLPRAVDLLADLVLHPLYLEEEMERERQVILEEIAAQDDTPEDLVQVLFARDFWQGQPLGRPILGTPRRWAPSGRTTCWPTAKAPTVRNIWWWPPRGGSGTRKCWTWWSPSSRIFLTAHPGEPDPGPRPPRACIFTPGTWSSYTSLWAPRACPPRMTAASPPRCSTSSWGAT